MRLRRCMRCVPTNKVAIFTRCTATPRQNTRSTIAVVPHCRNLFWSCSAKQLLEFTTGSVLPLISWSLFLESSQFQTPLAQEVTDFNFRLLRAPQAWAARWLRCSCPEGGVCFPRTWSQRVDPNSLSLLVLCSSPRTRVAPGWKCNCPQAFGRRRRVNLSVSKEITAGTLGVCLPARRVVTCSWLAQKPLSLSLECLIGGDQWLFAVPPQFTIHPSWRPGSPPVKSCLLESRPPHQELFL